VVVGLVGHFERLWDFETMNFVQSSGVLIK
jgi:hypothetical protein